MTTWMTVPEAAEHTRYHPVTVRKALEAGELHGSQRVKGGRWRVQLECADAWATGVPCEHKNNVVQLRR